MKKTGFALLALAFGACLVAGCASDLGETCETSGSTDECVDDAVCVQAVSGEDPTCRKACTDEILRTIDALSWTIAYFFWSAAGCGAPLSLSRFM